jgi:hypothetical protein
MRATHPRRLYTNHTNQRAAARAHPRAPARLSRTPLAPSHATASSMLGRRRSSLAPPPTTRCPPPAAQSPGDGGRGGWRRRPDLRGAGGGRECDPASESRTLLAGSAHEAGKRSSPPDRSGRGADGAWRGGLVSHDDWQLRPAAGRRATHRASWRAAGACSSAGRSKPAVMGQRLQREKEGRRKSAHT